MFILGDQLDRESAAFDGFDAATDAVFMAELSAESTYVWSSKVRSAVFLSAMRHFAQQALDDGLRIYYTRLDDPQAGVSLADELTRACAVLKPQSVVMVSPGEWRLREAFSTHPAAPELRADRHFLCAPDAFEAHAHGRKQLRMEYFYRAMRIRHGVLMDGDLPAGGKWNFDVENRKPFPASGPHTVPARHGFEPDAITREVIDLVNRNLAAHPGSLDAFDWPVTRTQALAALDDFLTHRLTRFGDHQDAMWTGQPWLYHSHLSSALNLKLLDPREVIARVEDAWRNGLAPLPAVEGFIRQILGWREYARGLYWRGMPGYLDANALDARQPLPAFYWSGATEMVCLAQSLGQTLAHGYAHHIQRLMVTGLYGLLLGIDPKALHGWYLAVYVDAIEWVEAPNTIGMALYADGGVMASKPYVATGRYIDRMSNYCKRCRFDPSRSTGDDACPFTTLYWQFLLRHQTRFARNPRMSLQLKNLARLDAATRMQIEARAETIRGNDGQPPRNTLKDLLT
ncbi:MAG: cryptochrome/photolyase family protein [Proteobacteria bacterium]|nr:cryptochrome/photolyase family protein [Burkholderiales bacterium]